MSCCDVHESQIDLDVASSDLQRAADLCGEEPSRMVGPSWTGDLLDVGYVVPWDPCLVLARLLPLLLSKTVGNGTAESNN